MRNPTLLLVYIALAQLATAVPVPAEEQAPIEDALRTTSQALQGTTKVITTGMAGGMAGMAGLGGAGALPIKKRQNNKSLDLDVAGVKPGDLMKMLQDPTSALKSLPIPAQGLKKRILGALGGLGSLTGLLGGLTPKPPPAAPPAAPPKAPAAPPPKAPDAPAPQVKEQGINKSVDIDDPPKGTEEEISGLEEALEGPPAPRNATIATSQAKGNASEAEEGPISKSTSSPNINSVRNDQAGESPLGGGDTQQNLQERMRILRRIVEGLMPTGKVSADGLKDPEVVLKKLGAAELVKMVVDAPEYTGFKEKRAPVDPLGQLDSVSDTLNSAAVLLKAVPLAQAAA